MKRGSDAWVKAGLTDRDLDKDGIKKWEVEKRDKGFTILRKSEGELVQNVAKNIKDHRNAKLLCTPGEHTQVEVGAIAQDPATGIWMKARADHRFWVETEEYTGWLIVDLKAFCLELQS